MRQKKDKYFSSKQLKTLEHTFTAFDEGTNFASNLHQLLIQTDVFSKIEFELLSLYLSSHSLYNLSNYSIQDMENGFPLQQWQKANKIKEIFDYLKQHAQSIDEENFDYIIEKFNSQYQHFVHE